MKLSRLHYLFTFWVLLFISIDSHAQKPVSKTDSILKRKALNLDSSKLGKPIFKVDSNALKKRILIKKNLKETLPKVFGVVPYLEKEKPRIVFIRSLILPGWGQISNKQYYKLPIVYGAAGVGGYFIYLNNKRCNEYVAYLKYISTYKETKITVTKNDIGFDINTNVKKISETVLIFDNNKLKSPTFEGGSTRGPYSKDLINNAAKQYRRWKQGTIIGFSAGWLLFAIDANVAAHLKSFDMTDDISATLKPSIFNVQGQTAAGLTLKFNFD